MQAINLDFNADWLKIIKSNLIGQGYDLTGLDDDQLSILYFSLRKRLISQTPRAIKKHPNFTSPSDLAQGLNTLEKNIQNGNDLRPYLSRKLMRISENDGLLYDWDIYHLNLGSELESDGFIKRTDPLLFARFDQNNAYFLGVFSHGAWSRQEMLRTIHNNWPDSIERYRLKGVLGVNKKFNDSEIGELRNAQINTIIEIEPGVVYMGPGGGIVGSGNSAEAVLEHLDKRRGLSNLEKSLTTNLEPLLESLFGNLDFIKNDMLEFELVRENGKFHVYEKNNDFYIQLNN